jgi:ribosomal protein S12 methylthiotransferase accessory factor
VTAIAHFPTSTGPPPPVGFLGTECRAAKGFVETTHRTCAPEETLERIRPLFAAAGITRIADITGLDRIGIPIILAMRPNAPTLANSSGKGFTLAAATVSAAMEGIELYFAEEFPLRREGPEHGLSVRATHRELAGAGLVCDAELLPLSRCSLFSPDEAEDWTIGFDLMTQAPMAVPFDVVSMIPGYQRDHGRLSFQVGSNGLASGNVFLEAVCSGLGEVIERDAVTCTTLRHGGRVDLASSVDLAEVSYPSVRSLLERLHGCGLSVAIFDCTIDTNVPCYEAMIFDDLIPDTGSSRGYGAHLDPEVAMVRALTEAVQSRDVYIAGSRDDLMYLEHRRMRRFGAAGSGAAPSRHVEAAPLRQSSAGDTFEEDCATLLGRLAGVGLGHAVVVELTPPDFPVSVVRVVVPGLEGYGSFAHYTPGPRGRRAVAIAAAEAADTTEVTE